MTRYAEVPAKPYWDARETPLYLDARDYPFVIAIEGLAYQPAQPNPEGEAESYRPVTLKWHRPDNGHEWTPATAVNAPRNNRIYKILPADTGSAVQISVNGVHIPVQFTTHGQAQLFAQAVEDANTED